MEVVWEESNSILEILIYAAPSQNRLLLETCSLKIMIYFTVALQGKKMLERLLLILEIFTSATKL